MSQTTPDVSDIRLQRITPVDGDDEIDIPGTLQEHCVDFEWTIVRPLCMIPESWRQSSSSPDVLLEILHVKTGIDWTKKVPKTDTGAPSHPSAESQLESHFLFGQEPQSCLGIIDATRREVRDLKLATKSLEGILKSASKGGECLFADILGKYLRDYHTTLGDVRKELHSLWENRTHCIMATLMLPKSSKEGEEFIKQIMWHISRSNCQLHITNQQLWSARKSLRKAFLSLNDAAQDLSERTSIDCPPPSPLPSESEPANMLPQLM
ncbi:hypothetical protein M231_02875 [Tremella mesenterica]|uniref:Uncharacterized protein n=1 Tax=Tremella mesenterica TaxID=5217 RepID=A0A4Q1BPR2_TREME|nr:uncharacterized protein TREMEDRAFT_61490 [Tremella mesenterica DSM 1558]EIW69729.1 hypothetical protein TREMEDRAFT_61490 [Tremella mesenterica DSM 1558]RXK39820.1 hypothetical protein M231_02875 [Tremella mesenterica]